MEKLWDDKIGDYIDCADEPMISVKTVKATADYKLYVSFENGEERVLDMKPFLKLAVFFPLRDLALFLKARVEFGTVVWSDDVDIDPGILYDESIPA